MVNTPVSAVMVHESPTPALDKGEGSFCVAIRHNVWTIMILGWVLEEGGGGGCGGACMGPRGVVVRAWVLEGVRAWVLEGWWCVHGS